MRNCKNCQAAKFPSVTRVSCASLFNTRLIQTFCTKKCILGFKPLSLTKSWSRAWQVGISTMNRRLYISLDSINQAVKSSLRLYIIIFRNAKTQVRATDETEHKGPRTKVRRDMQGRRRKSAIFFEFKFKFC